MAENYAKIRDGGKGAGLHYRAFEGFSRVVALKLRQLRREDFQIATRIREVGLERAARGSWFGEPDTVPAKVPLSLRKRERVRVRLDCMDTA